MRSFLESSVETSPEVLDYIVQGTSAVAAQSFFEGFVKHVHQAVQAPIVFVCSLSEDRTRARTIALWLGDQLAENFEYELEGTPCGNVVGKEICQYPRGVAELFPEDEVLVEMNAQCYLGVPFFYASGEPAGHMGIIDTRPRDDMDTVCAVVQIFANRATAEIENLKVQASLEASNAELQRSNQALAEFASVVAHDLKEPLRIVSCFTELVLDRYKDQLGGDGEKFITFAHEGAKRANQLVDDLLDYSRLDGERRAWASVDTREAVALSLSNLRVAVADIGATIEVGDLPTIQGHSGHLVRLFQNLISNALKFHGAEPLVVRVSAEREEGGWHLRVADNGQGIREDDLERIFGVFVRAHSRDYPGTGAGLAIAKRIVELHQGRIWAESVHGEGATFHMVLAG